MVKYILGRTYSFQSNVRSLKAIGYLVTCYPIYNILYFPEQAYFQTHFNEIYAGIWYVTKKYWSFWIMHPPPRAPPLHFLVSSIPPVDWKLSKHLLCKLIFTMLQAFVDTGAYLTIIWKAVLSILNYVSYKKSLSLSLLKYLPDSFHK